MPKKVAGGQYCNNLMQSRLQLHAEEPKTSQYAPICCLGVSHCSAPADVREAVAFTQDELPAALHSAKSAGIERLVLLSTCHRTEIYADFQAARTPTEHLDRRTELAAWLSTARNTDRGVVERHAYALRGEAAVRHLFNVAAGLESVIPGEPQIISQVATALRHSSAAHAASPALKRIFKAAVESGERAQASVWGRFRAADIGTAAVSAASLSLRSAGIELGSAQVAVIGAGEIAGLSLAALAEAGARSTVVVNRTVDRAAAAAGKHGGVARPLSDMLEVLSHCDVAIFALGARNAILNGAAAAFVMKDRPGRPLTLIDVALPRNIEPDVRSVGAVRLIAIDDLAGLVDDLYANRRAVIPAVEQILETERARLHSASSVPRLSLGALPSFT